MNLFKKMWMAEKSAMMLYLHLLKLKITGEIKATPVVSWKHREDYMKHPWRIVIKISKQDFCTIIIKIHWNKSVWFAIPVNIYKSERYWGDRKINLGVRGPVDKNCFKWLSIGKSEKLHMIVKILLHPLWNKA